MMPYFVCKHKKILSTIFSLGGIPYDLFDYKHDIDII